MGINFGVSASNLADGTSVIANNDKLSTSIGLNHGQYVLNGSVPVSTTFYSLSCPANVETGAYAGLNGASGSSGSVYFTPKYSGKIFISWNIVMNGSTTGTFPINYSIMYGTGTPPAQGLAVGLVGNYVIQAVGITITGSAPFQNNSTGSMVIDANLSIGTTYWFDVAIGIFNGNTYSNAVTVDLINAIISWFEI